MIDKLVKVVLPVGTLAAAGMTASLLMEQSEAPAPLVTQQQTASNIVVTEVAETAATPVAELVIPSAPEAAQQQMSLALPVLPESLKPTPAADALPVEEVASPLAENDVPDLIEDLADVPAADPACAVDAALRPRAAAMLTVDVSAPCAPNSRVEVRHAGIVVAATTNEDGTALVNLAALESPAQVFVGLADGSGTKVSHEVADLAEYRRIVVSQPHPDQDIELHVFEGEADYGSEGHVHPSNPRTIAHALSGNGGFLTFMGDPDADDARMALAYTFPRTAQDRIGRPDISIEVPITHRNCGQDRAAMTLQATWGQSVQELPVEVQLPDCDTVGEWVVLFGLFDTEDIASNR